MQAILKKHIPQIQLLCQQHRVKQLWAFGSVLTDTFSENSDIDFLYEFDEENLTHEEELDHLLGLIAGLQQLLGRRVDFVWYGGLQNPYFKAEIEKSKYLIYAQKPEEVPV